MSTKRELELEKQLWGERRAAVQLKANLLQAQSALLQVEAKECQAEVQRLDAEIAEWVETETQRVEPEALAA